MKYYVDNHTIFRHVERRASVWRTFETTEEQALVQWKEVLKDLRVEVVYVLSPAAKGKGERPYECLQDHLVRTCVREGNHQVRSSSSAPYEELHQYTTSGSLPLPEKSQCFAMKRLLRTKESLFRKYSQTIHVNQPAHKTKSEE